MQLNQLKVSDNGYKFKTDYTGINLKNDIYHFPLNVFPKKIQNMLFELEKNSSFPVAATSSTFLFIISMIIGNKRKIKIKDTWIDSSALWFAIIGKRGTMKTHAVEYMLRPINENEKEFADQYERELLDYDGMDEEEKTRWRKENKLFEPVRNQMMVKNSTREGLEYLLYQNQHGIGMYKDELFGLFEETKNYSAKGVMEFYLDVFNGKMVIVNRRRSRTFTVDNPFMSILGSIQPEKMMEIASVYTNNGVIDRFLYVPTSDEPSKFSFIEVQDEHKLYYDQFIKNIISRMNDVVTLELSNDSKKMFLDKMQEFESFRDNENTSEPIKNYISKIITYFGRFMIIFNEMFELGNVIQPESVDKAFQICSYFIGTGQNTFANFESKSGFDIICQRNNAKTKTEKIKILLNEFPEITNNSLMDYTGCTKGLISQLKKV